jgi:serine O-acetyltransferase
MIAVEGQNGTFEKVRPEPPEGMGKQNQNPPGLGLLKLLCEDWRTHDRNFFEQGFWAVAVHRLGNCRMSIRPKLVRAPFSVFYRILNKWVEWTCGISLPYTVKLGRRVRIWHHSGIILSATSIGDDVQIRQNTTLGVVRTEHHFELPVIGDRVDIGCGAVILGGISVGHDSVIGANAVVLKNVPPRSVVVGIPAKVIKTLGEPSA